MQWKYSRVCLGKLALLTYRSVWCVMGNESFGHRRGRRMTTGRDVLVRERDYQLFHSVDRLVNTAGGISFFDKSCNRTAQWTNPIDECKNN